MFVFYASDHCIENRPWLAYVVFPVIVVASFASAIEGPVPEMYQPYINGLIMLIYMVMAFFALWTLGLAVCSKIGNCLYLMTLFLSAALGAGLIAVLGTDIIWIISWILHCIAGIYIVFCPINSVDSFVPVPPCRSFSVNGFWAVIIWLIIDALFCVIVGWNKAVFMHPFAFVLGVLLASMYLKIPFVSNDLGDRTLWQWMKGENLSADLAWKDSWSEKRKKAYLEQKQEEERERLLQQEEQLLAQQQPDSTRQTRGVLCRCGQVVYVPIETKEHAFPCPDCHHKVHVPQI